MRDRAAIASSSMGRFQLLTALRAFRQGDFSARLPIGSTEIDAEIAEALNDIGSLGERITEEFVQLAEMVGKSGKTRHRAEVPDATGAWAASIDAVNGLVGDLLPPYQEAPKRYEYILTQKGLDLYPIIMSIVHWGNVHMVDLRGRPLLHEHKNCRKIFDPVMVCSECGEPLIAKAVYVHPGPGARQIPSRCRAIEYASTRST